jgi:outer membrane protein OmpA-like peptidoglycan-associated protein
VKSPVIFLAVLVCLGAGTIAQAQTANPLTPPTYGVNVVSRTTRAVQYEHRSGSTRVDFKGTNLMPAASGEAQVESKRGTMEIQADFKGLDNPTSFGTEYLTYVLWAISPEGRSINVGEVLVGGDHDSKLQVTTDLQAFALIVTAEPYFAVRRPSNVVILENAIRSDTDGTSEAVNAKYELIDRGGYIPTGYRFDPVVLNAKLPLEFFEARNAVRIAQSAGAETYAAPSYGKAMTQMKHADGLATMKNVNRKDLISASRETVQTADDAREISVKRIEADRLDAARNAEAAKLEDANRRRAEADRATAQAQRQQQNAVAESDRNRVIAADANQAAADAQQGQRNAEAESERNRLAAAASDEQLKQAVQDREELRAKLLRQFNLIFATRDTARGLIVSLSDVLFDTGKSTLLPGAREKLSKISGIVLAYPDLRLGIEGNTDNVGSDAMNQQLSERRADSVRDYLAQQSIPATSMTSQGFGETQPVASNDTAAGRQQNRRVELVVSGEIIGNTIGVEAQNLDLALPLR